MKPKLEMSKVSFWAIPVRNIYVLSLFVLNLDDGAKLPNIPVMLTSDFFSPSEKTMISSANAKWLWQAL